MHPNAYCSTIYNSQDTEATYTMEYHSARKRNKIVKFVKMWMDLETVTQSHKKKNKYYILIHIYEIWQMAQMVLFAKQK